MRLLCCNDYEKWSRGNLYEALEKPDSLCLGSKKEWLIETDEGMQLFDDASARGFLSTDNKNFVDVTEGFTLDKAIEYALKTDVISYNEDEGDFVLCYSDDKVYSLPLPSNVTSKYFELPDYISGEPLENRIRDIKDLCDGDYPEKEVSAIDSIRFLTALKKEVPEFFGWAIEESIYEISPEMKLKKKLMQDIGSHGSEIYDLIKELTFNCGFRNIVIPMSEFNSYCEEQGYSITELIRMGADLACSGKFNLDDTFFVKNRERTDPKDSFNDVFLTIPDDAASMVAYMNLHPDTYGLFAQELIKQYDKDEKIGRYLSDIGYNSLNEALKESVKVRSEFLKNELDKVDENFREMEEERG